MAKGKMSGKSPKQSITVKPQKDTMAKNVTDHMGNFSTSPGKVALSGSKKGRK